MGKGANDADRRAPRPKPRGAQTRFATGALHLTPTLHVDLLDPGGRQSNPPLGFSVQQVRHPPAVPVEQCHPFGTEYQGAEGVRRLARPEVLTSAAGDPLPLDPCRNRQVLMHVSA